MERCVRKRVLKRLKAASGLGRRGPRSERRERGEGPPRLMLIAPVAAALLALCVTPARAQDVLPDGPGMDILRTKCRNCHMPDRVTKVPGRAVEGWQTLVNTMMGRGAPVTEDELPVLVEYLAKNFPLDAKTPAVTYTPLAPMTAHVRAEFTEWDLPTPASRPSNPLAASDGSIWYTGQAANVLGRVDPKTGEIKEYELKTPQSGPYGLAEDAGGNIWYTGNSKAQIGMLDPRTGKISEYPISDPAARDPRSTVVDQKGNVWFTIQDGNKVGRFVPATGEFTLRNSPTPKSLPDGIAVNSKGVPFFAESGVNKVAAVDPATMAIREWALPDPAARPRRLAIDRNDVIWFTDYARGYLGRLDPVTGAVKEWASPGGAKSMPYAITAIGDDLWYSESGVAPNTLVRFEPATERFQIWNIPSGGGVVQSISVGKDGSLALAESELNKVALVKISR
jgi:virginiamycin B lyase